MKTKMKRVLALFLSLSLVLATFGDLAQVKAADYTDVTLTSTEGWNTSNDGTNWILYLNTSGYTSTDWSYKYKGFTIDVNGVTGTTTQVSSTENNRLYCTIPTSLVPTTDGTVFTIKAGQYAPDDAGTTTGINITADFQIVVSEGRLVHTTLVDPGSATTFNNTANSFYFYLYDKSGNLVSTGLESWTNFISPSWCDGTRVTQDAVANQWSLVYSGVFIDGSPMNYWDAHFKNVEAGTFYIDGLSAVSGTTVTIKGHFVSSTQADWVVQGNYYLQEISFTYDGTNWNYSSPTEYDGVTLTSTDGWNTAVSGDNWVLYLNTDSYTSTDWSYKYKGFTYECNGVTGTTGQISSAENNRLYCTIPTSVVSADNGTTFTIKAGTYDPDATGTIDGLCILNDFDIVVNEGRLMHTTVLEPASVEAFNSTANSFYFSLKDADGNGLATGCESWTNFLSPAYCDGTRIEQAKWSSIYTGVWVDGTPLAYWDAHFKNTAAGEFYIDGLSATNGTTIVVRGVFDSATQANWTSVGNFFLPELTFTYDGSTWTYVDSSSIIEHTGTPIFDESNGELGFYFTAGETAFPYDAANWSIIATAEDTEESGVFLNGEKTEVYLKKVDQDRWYVCMSDAEIVPEADDEITIAGSFVYQNHRITFEEATFTFNGTQYEGPSTTYNGTPELLEIGEYGSAAGFYFKAGDGAPYATDWSLTSTAIDGEENGVFINDVKTAIYLKKTNTDEWYVCISDAGVTLNAGDVLTVKGSFKIGNTSDTVVFTEKDFVFNGKRFSDGQFTATDFTITGLAYSDINYDTTNNRWNMYFTLSANIPGDVDSTYYPYMTYEIDGTEYTTHWFKSSSAHTVDGETIYNLYFPIEALPQTLEQEYAITVKAGTQQGRISGTNAARTDGINLTEDYQFVVGGDYEASAPTIDYTMSNGGNENGIYLSSGDAFPTIGWDYSLTKVESNDGIYVDNASTDVFIKKYEDNKYYVCLSDMGITAVEGTIVMLKGAFTTAGLNTVTFKTAKYIYTDGQWKVYTATVEIDSTGVWGDATGTSELNSADLIRIKRYLAKETEEIGLYDADLNASGNIDKYDTRLVRRLLIGDEYSRYGSNLEGAPEYTNTDDEMRLAAYVAPAYNADTIATALQTYADAGFTTIIGENRVMYGDANLDAYMKAAQNAGLDVLVQSGNIQNMAMGNITYDVNTIETEFNALLKYDNFRGLFLGDEPEIAELESHTNVLTTLKSLNAEHGKDLFIAHHPLYTEETYLWNDDSLSLPEKYLKYAETYGGLFGEFMYDFYPFRHSYSFELFENEIGAEDYMRDGWFNNLTLAATASKGKVPTGITVQSYAENLNSKDHYRDVTEADVSFQVYSALAYGMKSIQYFTYDEHWDTGVGTTNCMIYGGGKTAIYDAVKNVNAEIKAIDHMMLNFNWQGTIGIPVDDEDGLMSYVTSYDYSSPRISAYSATNDAIIGCLKDLNGYDGFMLVNAKDPIDNVSVTVSVTFNDATHAKVYIDGVESTVALTDGKYSATLTPGQGIFVIPYIAE